MTLTPNKVPLPPELEKTMNTWRPLSSYKLNYTNGDYPALSFAYAVLAGGEHAIYCDHSEDFFNAYMVDAVVDQARKKGDADVEAVRRALGDVTAARAKADAYVEETRAKAADRALGLAGIFNAMYAKKLTMSKLPPEQQEPILPTEAEVDGILEIIRAEMLGISPAFFAW